MKKISLPSFIILSFFVSYLFFLGKSEAQTTFTVNSTANDDDGACNAAPDCTLREAINAANGDSLKDTIAFGLGAGTPSIDVSSGSGALPGLSQPVILNGNTGGATRVELNGNGGGGNGLVVSGGSSEIRNLVINRFSGAGLVLNTNGGNIVAGNLIGTDAAGTADQGNGTNGIQVNAVSDNVIGGITPADRNVISGNSNFSILINDNANRNRVIGNFIGTDINGATEISGLGGVLIQVDSVENVVGGLTPEERNIVADGISFQASANANQILGNYIGTDVTGTVGLSACSSGISILFDCSDNVIGGTSPGSGNVIGGCFSNGIRLSGAVHDNIVQGNRIGLAPSGTLLVPNGGNGISIEANQTGGAFDNLIGGLTPEAANHIGGSGENGILIRGGDVTGNVIQGNWIGTDSLGADLGNTLSGILLDRDVFGNTIGGTTPGAGNHIAFNDGNGVTADPMCLAGNAIWGNEIFSNGGLGIDLGDDGITANDLGDGDTGPNNLQNFPVLTEATTVGGNLAVTGSLNGPANSTFRLEFFLNDSLDASGNGEGQNFIGFVDVATDGGGNANLDLTLPVPAAATKFLASTATHLTTNDTSEFSNGIQVVALEDCGNGLDDDGDNQVDCADSDCPSCPLPPTETLCNDGLDQDNDGLVDCDDPDCAANGACTLDVSGSGCSMQNAKPDGSQPSHALTLVFGLLSVFIAKRRLQKQV